jgi:hypothetical protein
MNRRRILLSLVAVGAAFVSRAATAQDEPTGVFRMSYTTPEIVGEQSAESLANVFPTDEPLRWEVYVPYNYDPQRPAGVFVYADPRDWGGMPDKWREVFNQRNMIWIGANLSDRRPSDLQRTWAAILGPRAIEKQYKIDLNRLYIGSSEDAAAIAVTVMMSSGEYVGAVYISGSQYWQGDAPPQIESFRRKYHVFITGSNDKALAAIRRDIENYKSEGVTNIKLIYRPEGLRGEPAPEDIDEALRYLDSRGNQ